MEKHILISHSHEDTELAAVISQMLRRVTLNQCSVWFSSDPEGNGGTGVGDRWAVTVRENIQKSRAIIALITPKSVNRPWIYFETGFGAADSEREIIPVSVGMLDLRSIPPPLNMYQSYRLADSSSLLLFIRKVLASFDVYYDEEMANVAIAPVVEAITTQMAHDQLASPQASELTNFELLGEITAHFDRSIFQIANRVEYRAESSPKEEAVYYSVPLSISFPTKSWRDELAISAAETVQDKLHEIYFKLQPTVDPFTYLESWILREKKSGVQLIMLQVTEWIPASHVFKPGSSWEVLPLEKPYVVDRSRD